jgi:hypothetical protein
MVRDRGCVRKRRKYVIGVKKRRRRMVVMKVKKGIILNPGDSTTVEAGYTSWKLPTTSEVGNAPRADLTCHKSGGRGPYSRLKSPMSEAR